jgi:hypothetical protein
MKQYRKKPVVVHAMQWDGTSISASEIIDDLIKLSKNWPELDESLHGKSKGIGYFNLPGEKFSFEVMTLEGKMQITPNDYVIVGLAGEVYPCKPDIFEKTYKEVEDEKLA